MTMHPATPIADTSIRQSVFPALLSAIGRQAAPIVGVGLLNMAISLTDTLMMARFKRGALADGALVSDAYSIAFYFAAGVLGAATPLAASAVGARERSRVGSIFCEAMVLLLALAGTGYVLIGRSVPFLTRAGISFSDAPAAAAFAHYLALAFGPMLLIVLCRNLLALCGKGHLPVVVLATAVPVNALGNHAFMYGNFGAPDLGLAGAGAATLLVACFAAAASLSYLLFSPSTRELAIIASIRRVGLVGVSGQAKLGFFIGAATVAETGAFMASTPLVGAINPGAVAAHVVALRTFGLGYCIVFGLAQGLTVVAAHCRGAGDLRDQAELVRFALAIGAALAALFLAGAFLFQTALALSSSRGPGGPTLLVLLGVVLAGISVNATGAALLKARGRAAAPAAAALVAYWIAGPAICLSLVQILPGVVATWAGLAIASWMAAAATWARLRGEMPWRVRGLSHVREPFRQHGGVVATSRDDCMSVFGVDNAAVALR